MRKIIFLNGKFISQVEAKISVLEPSLLYGWGLFETMRSYKRNIVYLDAHLRRLKDSCNLISIDLTYSPSKIRALIQKIVIINGFKDAYVRLNVWKRKKGSNLCISVKPYQAYSAKIYRQGFRACLSRYRQNETSILSRIKSTNYLLFRLAYQQVRKRGFDEAIILNSRGYIAESSRANIFLVKQKELFTPQLDCGCLDGITRKVILDLAKKFHIKTHQVKITPFNLKDADEAFLTNSLMGIMPLVYFQGLSINKGRAGEITKFFMKGYRRLLKNEI